MGQPPLAQALNQQQRMTGGPAQAPVAGQVRNQQYAQNAALPEAQRQALWGQGSQWYANHHPGANVGAGGGWNFPQQPPMNGAPMHAPGYAGGVGANGGWNMPPMNGAPATMPTQNQPIFGGVSRAPGMGMQNPQMGLPGMLANNPFLQAYMQRAF